MDQLELFPDDIVNKKTNNQSRLPTECMCDLEIASVFAFA